MSQEWHKVSQESQPVGYKTLIHKEFIQPDGVQATFTTWGREGGRNVAVIALTRLHEVVIARQYRPGPERLFDELPGGGAEPGETLPAAAARELFEETGYVSDEPFEEIGVAYRDAYANESNVYFLAQNCYKQGAQVLDEGEFVTTVLISTKALLHNARTGRMTDAVAVLMAFDRLV